MRDQLAELCGLTSHELALIEEGRTPPPQQMAQLSRRLNQLEDDGWAPSVLWDDWFSRRQELQQQLRFLVDRSFNPVDDAMQLRKVSSIGAAIRATRERWGISKVELAAASGLTVRRLEAVERDEHNARAAADYAVAGLLDLLAGDRDESQSKPEDPGSHTYPGPKGEFCDWLAWQQRPLR